MRTSQAGQALSNFRTNRVARLVLHAEGTAGAPPTARRPLALSTIIELRETLGHLDRDPEVQVITLEGEGSVFCNAGFALDALEDYQGLIEDLITLGTPVIAKVNGDALSAGLGLVLAAPFAIASTRSHLGTPDIDQASFPSLLLPLLTRLMPRRRLMSLVLLNRRMDAYEAHELGLVQDAVPPEELDAVVDGWIDRLCAKSVAGLRSGLAALAIADRALTSELTALRVHLQSIGTHPR